MKKLDRRQFIWQSSAIAGSMTFYSITARGAKPQPITASHSVNTAIYAAHMVALAKGFMKDQGLTMHVIEAKGGSNVRRILAAGQVGYALGDSGHPLQLSTRGKSAKMLMATDNRCSYANIIVRQELYDKGFTSVEKLAEYKGEGGAKPVIAATGIGSGTWLYGTYVLEQHGVADRFNWIGGGGSKTMLGGLKTDKFDAIMAVPAWQFAAEDGGYGQAIYDVADVGTWNKTFGGNIPTTIVYVLENATTENAELTQKYINAMYKSMQWLKDNSTDAIYAAIGEEYMGRFKADQAKREIDYYKAMWHYEGDIAEADFNNGAKVWFREGTKMKAIPYGQVVDTRFLAEAKKEA
jgi:NitT/TauT family transport system substrate-binding protein